MLAGGQSTSENMPLPKCLRSMALRRDCADCKTLGRPIIRLCILGEGSDNMEVTHEVSSEQLTF